VGKFQGGKYLIDVKATEIGPLNSIKRIFAGRGNKSPGRRNIREKYGPIVTVMPQPVFASRPRMKKRGKDWSLRVEAIHKNWEGKEGKKGDLRITTCNQTKGRVGASEASKVEVGKGNSRIVRCPLEKKERRGGIKDPFLKMHSSGKKLKGRQAQSEGICERNGTSNGKRSR